MNRPRGSDEELMQRAVTSAGRVLTTDEVATAVLRRHRRRTLS